MIRTTEILSPNAKLVDEVVGWLLGNDRFKGRVRCVDGAHSLAHVMVVVPTAQSGRNLRLQLAKNAHERGWGGILPPMVVLPMEIVRTADSSLRTATDVELMAAFLKFVEAQSKEDASFGKFPHLFRPTLVNDFRAQLAFFDQLTDIWRILAGGGITMADVPINPNAQEILAGALGDELLRWQELARFEETFFGQLHQMGLRHQAEEIKLAKVLPRPLPAEIDEVVLPVLADPITPLYDVLQQQRDELKVTVLLHCERNDANRFDEWGRPKVECWTGQSRPMLTELRDDDIVITLSDADLAKIIARDFPSPEEKRLRPSLGLCDNSFFPELSAAFLNRGYSLHNPERHRLSVSSLGRMLLNLLELFASRKGRLPWKPWVELMREEDVLTALASNPNMPRRTEILSGVDICQNSFLPTMLPHNLEFSLDIVPKRDQDRFTCFLVASKQFLAMLEQAWGNDASPASFLRAMLMEIFAKRRFDGGLASQEFRAAADVAGEVLNAFENETLKAMHLSEVATIGLLRKNLSVASYSLEPSDRNSINTEGWLELVWSAADKVALSGFTEGSVPDSVVGHPFVPDELRNVLGLTSNAKRMARDTMLLCDIVRSRLETAGAVRAYLSLANPSGDQRCPSRLLFLVPDADLHKRVSHLFSDIPPGEVREARKVEENWRLNLPLKCKIDKFSASSIDTWLKCPFTYFLKYAMGMRKVEEKEELGADDFGTLIHHVLEDYANAQLSRTERGLPQLSNEEDIAKELMRLLERRRDCYGKRLALKLCLQFESAKGRLLEFARLQSFWAQNGWKIAEKPEFDFTVRPFAGEGDCDVLINGAIDRIDYHPDCGYRIIDFKTWDKPGSVSSRIYKDNRFLSIQLLLYAHCLETLDARFKGNISDCCYAVLGKTAENTVVLGSRYDQGNFEAVRTKNKFKLLDHYEEALDAARAAIKGIRDNVFWPPSPDEQWKNDFSELFVISPAKDLAGTAWLNDQLRKVEKVEGAENVGQNTQPPQPPQPSQPTQPTQPSQPSQPSL